jgi:hypothetical protein
VPLQASRRVTLPLVVAWSCLVTYLVAARVVGNWFPLSTFDMYQARAPEAVARVVVADREGRRHELGQYEGYACEPLRLELAQTVAERCSEEHRPLPYVVRDQQLWLDGHIDARGGPETIAIVSRAYVLAERRGAPAYTDCVLARCTARRRGGSP